MNNSQRSQAKVVKSTKAVTKPSETNAKEQADARSNEPAILTPIKCGVRELDKVVLKDFNNSIKDSGRWPLLIDVNGQAAGFLKYRNVNYLCTLVRDDMSPEAIRLALIGSIRTGKPMILDMAETDMLDHVEEIMKEIQPNLFNDIVSKEILKQEKYADLIRREDQDSIPAVQDGDVHRPELFLFIAITSLESPPIRMLKLFFPIRIE